MNPQLKSKTRWTNKPLGMLLTMLCAFTIAPVTDGAIVQEGKPTTQKDVAVTRSSSELKREAGKHLSKAEHYEQQAEAQQQEIKRVRKEFAAESKKIAVLPKAANENPYVKKLRLQTEKRVKELEAQAQESSEMAQYHRTRAREVQDEALFSRLP